MVSDVTRILQERGAHFELLHHGRATDGMQEATSLGLAPGDVLKTVVLETRSGRVLAVLPASRRLDMDLVREAIGDRHARLATEGEIERELPGWELGALPPLGSLLHATVYVDPEVLRHPVVTFAAGSQTDSVRGPTDELFLGETVTVTPIAEQPGPRADDH